MQIALISVAPPYRGGISKHTSILVENLSKNHSVDVINYSRQYPDFLFPGKTQYLDDKSENDNSSRMIDSINPLTWFSTGNKLAKKNYDLVIFRFWNPFFAPALGVISGIIKKKSSYTKLMSLCDNILPHEKTPFAYFLTTYLFDKLDGHIVQSSQTENELQEVVENPVYEKRFHPIYTNFPKKIDKITARKKLGLSAKNIILYFGIIRDYKGFDILLNAIAELKDSGLDFHLLAGGECYGSDEKYTQLISNLGISDYITWHNKYIPDSEVSNYFSAADVVALPYRTASQSGVTQIAYSYDLPVIVTKVGGLPEIVDEGQSGITIEPENPTELANILEKNLEAGTFLEMATYIKKFKQKFSWEYFVNGIELVYSKI
ncbi:MAG TPA: glycosyltransferase [Candidatus Marinimicrobia bacterium]|jgi:glycosyltransferase involved in cell wall biosynthesis|nr:glycosyltransferase [Candidatus Neomarinimicrobiota bacterium]